MQPGDERVIRHHTRAWTGAENIARFDETDIRPHALPTNTHPAQSPTQYEHRSVEERDRWETPPSLASSSSRCGPSGDGDSFQQEETLRIIHSSREGTDSLLPASGATSLFLVSVSPGPGSRSLDSSTLLRLRPSRSLEEIELKRRRAATPMPVPESQAHERRHARMEGDRTRTKDRRSTNQPTWLRDCTEGGRRPDWSVDLQPRKTRHRSEQHSNGHPCQ